MKLRMVLTLSWMACGACSTSQAEPPLPPLEYGVVTAPPNALGAYSPSAWPLPSVLASPGSHAAQPEETEEETEQEPTPSPQAPDEGVPL